MLNVYFKDGNAFAFAGQDNYDKLCKWVTENIYEKMTDPPYNLRRIPLTSEESGKNIAAPIKEVNITLNLRRK